MLMKTIPLRLPDGFAHPPTATCLSCEVRGQALFGALDAQALGEVHAHISSRETLAGQAVYAAGRKGAAVYTVRSGIVRFERFTQGGERRIVRLAGPGDLIGQEALLGRPYAEDAVACTTAHLCRIPTTLVLQMAQQRYDLQQALWARWQQALEHTQDWVADLTTGPARRRVFKLLGRIAGFETGSDLIWLPRRDEIGAMLDITMETASRIVSALRREGVLELLPPSHARIHQARWHEGLEQLEG